jgi:Flp pilus assembly protein TadG
MFGKLATAFLRSASSLLSARSGSAAVTFGISLIPLAASVGAAVDYSKATEVRAKLQNALDVAVLAGVKASSAKATTASTVFTANFSDSLAQNVSSSFTANTDGSLSGTAQAAVPTSMLAILKVSTISVTASAQAKIRNTSSSTSNTVCLLLVDPTASQSLLINSGAKINAPDCEIDVRSTANPAAMFNSGTTLNVKKICVAGSNVTMNGGTLSVVQTGCAAISDPLAGTLPVVSAGTCTVSNKSYDGSSITLDPGTYCGSINFNGSPTITFNPGLYVIKGGTMTINSGAKITGNGVTFYFADKDSKIQFNGTTTITLTAPTSGTYSGILMFEPSGLAQSQLVFNGTTASTLQGLMYLPSRQVTFNSTSTLSAEKISMVFATLIVNATDWNFQAGSATTLSRVITTTSGATVPYLTN